MYHILILKGVYNLDRAYPGRYTDVLYLDYEGVYNSSLRQYDVTHLDCEGVYNRYPFIQSII